MDFRWSADDDAFRTEVRRFIDDTLPAGWDEMNLDEAEEFQFAGPIQKKLAANKWRIMHWPQEYGGLGFSLWRQLIFSEEFTYRRMPGSADAGAHPVAALLMHSGTPAQRSRFMGPIARAEIKFCLLFTEPAAGSDLASLQTRAVKDGDDYVINGQKVFNTGAHLADWGLLAARTDQEVPKHKGISLFIVNMKAPGVTVRPLINLTGAHAQNEVFLDDVRVPRDSIIGEENQGWYQLASSLSTERSGVTGINRFALCKRLLDDLAGFARTTSMNGQNVGKRPEVRSRLAEAAIATELGRFILYRAVGMNDNGLDSTRLNSASKIFGGELAQRLANTGVSMMGLYGQLRRGTKHAPLQGTIERMYRETVYFTIGLGTSEVNRNVIAQRGLGLPR
ncbi:MAG: acyl-CoA dehydrogenase [Dehalococcoidia bacterium]|nr:acyl-CoA dehydrogenase [Dehalococcoidia bacterium]